jgi:tRNA pseudouridine65 synthase
MTLEIIYEDDHLIAINKPHGLLVHRSSIATNTDVYALQLLRDQVGYHVYPVHRLDRKTSGVLLFSKTAEFVSQIQAQLQADCSVKKYSAIVRGYFPEEILVDYPLTNEKGKTQDAITLFKCLKHIELELPFGKHRTSRYSLIEAYPKTGRMHQIRKHLNHLRYPIIGDRPHGCNKQNKLFLDKWQLNIMLLHAQELNFIHPASKETIRIEADYSEEFVRIFNVLIQP